MTLSSVYKKSTVIFSFFFIDGERICEYSRETMTEQEFKLWVINVVIDGSKSRREIVKRLRNNGFKFLASGTYKLAYRHTKYRNHVVKVYHVGEDSTADCPDEVPEDVSEYYLHPIHRTDDYMIQCYADGQGGSGEDAYDWFLNNTELDCYDLHEGNCRYHQRHPVIIDFCS